MARCEDPAFGDQTFGDLAFGDPSDSTARRSMSGCARSAEARTSRRSPKRRGGPVVAGVAIASLLLGCSVWEGDIGAEDEQPWEEGAGGRPVTVSEPESDGGLFDVSFFGGDDDADRVQLPVNRHLWRATLDTLSFLPLSSTDPYGGVIVTDWGAAPDAPGERFKVTAYITSAVLKPQALRVVVNRQIQQDGAWVAADVSPETARQLEDAILTRARQLRQAEGE